MPEIRKLWINVFAYIAPPHKCAFTPPPEK
jgi:hypothetical protein